MRIPGLVALLVALVLAAPCGAGADDAARPAGWSDRSYYVAMPDGTRLALSWYFPGGVEPDHPRPVLLVQTRYGRATNARYAAPWQAAGYSVAVVDTRGSTASFGPRDADIGPDEVRDMEAIVAHLASRPWSNGQVIASGVSYMADTADLASSRPAPALVAAIPRETDFDVYLDLFAPGGVFNDWMMTAWGGYALEIDEGRDGRGQGLDCHARLPDCAKLFPTLQPVDGDGEFAELRAALGSRHHWTPDTYSGADFRDDVAKNGLTLYAGSPSSRLADIRREHKPVQYWGSWVDGGTAEAALARYRSAPEVVTDVWITANNHGHNVGADPLRPGQKDPVPATSEQFAANLSFAERIRSGDQPARAIHYYVMGAGVLRTSATWPPAGVRLERLRLAAGHRLVRGAAAAGRDRYAVDFSATTGKATRWSTQFGTPPAYPDRQDADRKLLVYDGDPLVADTLLAGYPLVHLRLSSATRDPAVFVYLEDVAPDGRVSYLTEGELRLVNRRPADPATLPYDQGPLPHSFRRADALPVRPGELLQADFALFPTAALIPRGHRLRIAIAGSDADTFRRYSEGLPDTYTIERGGRQGSSVELPLAPWNP